MAYVERKASLRILLSAYACEPGKGSEPGVGWHWAIEMAKLGHHVTVLTRENNRHAIEQALSGKNASPDAATYADNLEFAFYDMPKWARWWKRNGRGVRLYYVLWQIGAYIVARRVHQQQPFDAVHHLTFGVLRHPSLMGRLGIPFVVGPMGGGEATPIKLRAIYSWRARCIERLRDLSNALSRYDPLVRNMYRDAGSILCKSPASQAWVPAAFRGRARCLLEIGIDVAVPAPASEQNLTATATATLQLVYVGRFVMWKGMELGLRAVAILRARGVDVRLTMVGRGPDEQRWRRLANDLGITEAVTWIPWLAQPELMKLYQSFDGLLFPSLHDSSGNVVLEAFAHGLPVICLDLGGPAEMVNEQCGVVVRTEGKAVRQVIESMANSLYAYAVQPMWRSALREGARRRAEEFGWNKVVARVWGEDGIGVMLVRSSRDSNARGFESAPSGAKVPQSTGRAVVRDPS